MTITGAPGVGKTSLVRELWETLAEEVPAPLRRTGRCLPYGDGITYWPLAGGPTRAVRAARRRSPEGGPAQLAGREILGLALGLDVAGDLHPLEARERFTERSSTSSRVSATNGRR